jgi:hypothetical protein
MSLFFKQIQPPNQAKAAFHLIYSDNSGCVDAHPPFFFDHGDCCRIQSSKAFFIGIFDDLVWSPECDDTLIENQDQALVLDTAVSKTFTWIRFQRLKFSVAL